MTHSRWLAALCMLVATETAAFADAPKDKPVAGAPAKPATATPVAQPVKPATATPVAAQPAKPAGAATPAVAQPVKPADAGPTADQRAQMRKMRDEREKRVHDRGEVFEKIAVKKDYTGEYVLFRDKDVTAFLDLKDPQHPRYKEGDDEDEKPPADPNKRRVHILVVPNEPRETIGKTVSSNITEADLEATLKVMKAADALAKRLKLKDPTIYVKSPARVGVGYLHVHVIAEVDSKFKYPAALK